MNEDIIGTATDLSTGETSPLRIGRPSGLTKEVYDALVHSFKSESSIQTVAARCGVAYSTLHRWLSKGRAGHPDYMKFTLDVAVARGIHKSKWVENVERIAEGDTPQALRANLSLLARMFPDEWGDRDTAANEEHKAKRDETEFLKSLSAEDVKHLQEINAKRQLVSNTKSDDD